MGGSTNAAITIQDAVFVNTPPTIAASGGSASANEGSSANKTGTFSDIDPGDSVTISKVSGPGTITQTGTSSGTWTWSYSASDGPESGTVIVKAADTHGGSTTTSFSYTITNVSPVVSASSTEPIIDAGVSYLEVGTAFTGGGTFTDPGADTWTGTVNWGDGGDAQSLALSGKNFTLNHTYANPGTFTTTVTITDDDGGVGTQTLTVTVVQVSEMVVSDAVISSNTLSINTSTSVDFYIAEITSGADAGTAKLMLDALGTPQTSQAGAHVLWSVSGSAASPNSGNFGAADPVVTLTPTGGNRDFVATIGFDTNGDGTLQQTEIDRTANVHVLRLDWTLISTNSDGSAVVDAMEEDPLEYNGNVLGYPENGAVNFILYTTNSDGTVAEIDNLNANNSNFMLPSGLVLDGDTDHKFKYTTYAEATIGNAVVRSNEIDTDIYELWINYFRDDATGKDWKVTVGDAIAYDAFAASKCTDWFWDMPDGFEDAWSPARGDAKSGNQMVIPFSDLSDAENDWFGDAYGTVYVKCVSGLGVTHEFYSTDMPTPQKAKVFFDPSKTLDGNNAAAVGGIPAWFTFWNQTAAGSNNVSFDSTLGAGTYGVTRWYRDTTTGEVTDVDQPLIGGSANGSSSVGLTTTTITGIDTFYMTVRHEMLHYDELTASIGEPNVDGDGLAASLEGDKNGNGVIDGGETDPALFSTHGITPSGPSDVEWRAYWMESNAWNSSIGTFDSVDWSKGGKQW